MASTVAALPVARLRFHWAKSARMSASCWGVQVDDVAASGEAARARKTVAAIRMFRWVFIVGDELRGDAGMEQREPTKNEAVLAIILCPKS